MPWRNRRSCGYCGETVVLNHRFPEGIAMPFRRLPMHVFALVVLAPPAILIVSGCEKGGGLSRGKTDAMSTPTDSSASGNQNSDSGPDASNLGTQGDAFTPGTPGDAFDPGTPSDAFDPGTPGDAFDPGTLGDTFGPGTPGDAFDAGTTS